MKFTFNNYKIFCKDFKLKQSYYKNLRIFKKYCDGNLDIIFNIKGDYNEKKIFYRK